MHQHVGHVPNLDTTGLTVIITCFTTKSSDHSIYALSINKTFGTKGQVQGLVPPFRSRIVKFPSAVFQS